MKMKTPRIVPLSRQAIEILTELRRGFHEFLRTLLKNQQQSLE